MGQLKEVHNFRDVGKTINDFLGERRLREGVFFRSARLDEGTDNDKVLIRDEIGIKTVIDLRTKTELLKQADKHRSKSTASQLQTREDIASPLHIPGLKYHEIKITGRPFEKFLLSLLSWWGLFRVIFLYVIGQRLRAVHIMARDVMIPRGLKTLGTDTLDRSGDDIRKVLDLYTRPEGLPSVVHCTHGKDRTGLICTLVLMILDVPVRAIRYDYYLTDTAAAPSQLEERLREVREVGLADDWSKTVPGMIEATEQHLQRTYGGLNQYLDSIGFGEDSRAQVRRTLLY